MLCIVQVTAMRNDSIVKHIRDIIILPVTVTVVIPYLIYDQSRTFTAGTLFTDIVGLLFLTPGLFLFFYTVYLFKTAGKGTLAPWAPTQKLVILGPYKYCRNPMITGVFFILIAETLFLQSTDMLIWASAFFLINTIYFILKEEPDLYKRFGDDYKKYKEGVPRWIPRFTPYSKDD